MYRASSKAISISSQSAAHQVSVIMASQACTSLIPANNLTAKVEMPTDIHPLPDDITAYVRCPASHLTADKQFVYPFTLEPHILAMNPQPHQQIAQTRTQHAAYLSERKEQDARKEWVLCHSAANRQERQTEQDGSRVRSEFIPDPAQYETCPGCYCYGFAGQGGEESRSNG